MPTLELLKNRKRTGYDEQNRKEKRKIYSSSRYRKIRALKIQNNPVCEICELMNKTSADRIQVHHWKQFFNQLPDERDRLAHDYNNLVTLCHKCHEEIHSGYLRGCYSIDDVIKRLKELNKI